MSRVFIKTATAKADDTQREIDAAKGSAAAHGLDVKFQTMATRRSQLTKSFAAAFGTPAADSIRNDLRQLLNQMLANREGAVAQGNGPAKQQASEIREAIQKLR